jgi:hypothetical protein
VVRPFSADCSQACETSQRPAHLTKVAHLTSTSFACTRRIF